MLKDRLRVVKIEKKNDKETEDFMWYGMTQFIVPGLLEMMYQLKIKMTNKVQLKTNSRNSFRSSAFRRGSNLLPSEKFFDMRFWPPILSLPDCHGTPEGWD